ncbi:MAG: ABC transporter ATP-binding protein [Proteobacteria bacterium]|nr:ABC transporter ATP-binding protein [Pseudomonadota bacterium]MDA1357044.1 ABC transporter ATP-binding protein [Pseudomonadota bacterium]
MLEVDTLHSGYGRIPILEGVSLSLQEGEIVGILGHNGMGKTTLLRTLIGEIKTNRGTIRFNGKDITRLSRFRRARLGMGYVPQGRDIYPQLTVLENMKMGEVVRGGESAIPEMLEYFPLLKDLLNRPGRALSGGEQQILALARCLVGRPKLILLDEPTEGIQPSIVDQIMEKLDTLSTALGLTILLVEQDLQFIAKLAGRVLIMQKGRIITSIAPSQLNDQEIVDEYLGI